MREGKKLGGLIFYYISDTHNIQKRQTLARHTVKNCITLHRFHVHIYSAYTFANNIKNLISLFITVKYIIECLMRMQIYQLNLMCFLGENRASLVCQRRHLTATPRLYLSL